jgi:hypothetical protein
VWASLWVSTPTGELDEVCQHGHALTPCRTSTWTGLVRTDARQDGDGTHPLSSGGQAPPSGQQRRSRAAPGNNGWTSPLQDTTRVSHSKGHARCHRSRPGSSPNHRAVSQSLHYVLLKPTRAHWPESSPNLTCLEPTGTDSAEDWQLSPKQLCSSDLERHWRLAGLDIALAAAKVAAAAKRRHGTIMGRTAGEGTWCLAVA